MTLNLLELFENEDVILIRDKILDHLEQYDHEKGVISVFFGLTYAAAIVCSSYIGVENNPHRMWAEGPTMRERQISEHNKNAFLKVVLNFLVEASEAPVEGEAKEDE